MELGLLDGGEVDDVARQMDLVEQIPLKSASRCGRQAPTSPRVSVRSSATSCCVDKIACSVAASSSRASATGKTLDSFDLEFNKKTNRQLVYELAAARFVDQREDVLFLGAPGTGKSHLAQALGLCAIQQGHRVIYREAHVLLEELADASLEKSGRRS